MRNVSTLTIVVAVTTCACGCYTKRPELRGTVVNVWTDAPVANATVTVEKDALRNPRTQVTTDADGNFVVPRQTGFGGLKEGRWTYPVTVTADGFADSTVDVMMSSRKPVDRIDGFRFELVDNSAAAHGQ